MGSLWINGGQSGTFNVSWEDSRESLGISLILGLAFHSICCFLSALVWVKENDFDGFRRHVRCGWFCTSVACCSSYYHSLLLIVLSFCCRVAEGQVKECVVVLGKCHGNAILPWYTYFASLYLFPLIVLWLRLSFLLSWVGLLESGVWWMCLGFGGLTIT